MSFPFKHIEEHKVYASTFLHRVEARFHYSTNSELFPAVIGNYLEDYFGLVLSPGQIEGFAVVPIRFSAKNGDIKCKITDDFIEIVCQHSAYTSFDETLKPLLNIFQAMMLLTQADIHGLSLQKLNGLPAGKAVANEVVMSTMFTGDFLNADFYDMELGGPDDVTHRLLVIQSDDKNQKLYMIGGVEGVKDNENIKAASFRSVADYNGSVAAENITATFMELNNTLYDAFHWAINPELITMMEKEVDK